MIDLLKEGLTALRGSSLWKDWAYRLFSSIAGLVALAGVVQDPTLRPLQVLETASTWLGAPLGTSLAEADKWMVSRADVLLWVTLLLGAAVTGALGFGVMRAEGALRRRQRRIARNNARKQDILFPPETDRHLLNVSHPGEVEALEEDTNDEVDEILALREDVASMANWSFASIVLIGVSVLQAGGTPLHLLWWMAALGIVATATYACSDDFSKKSFSQGAQLIARILGSSLLNVLLMGLLLPVWVLGLLVSGPSTARRT